MLSIASRSLFAKRTFSSVLRYGRNVAFSGTVGSEDSHDDFKTQTTEASVAPDVFDTIRDDISKNRIFVYMKGHPQAPRCGFSMTACRILDAYGESGGGIGPGLMSVGAQYGSRDVLEDQELREGIKKFSNWPTIPQVFVDGEFIGGCDILMQMHENGELPQVLKP